MTALALSPEQFIFAQGEELKTTSLKISEAFGKLHKNVIRDIEKIISNTAALEHAPKFELMQIDVEIGNGATRKSPVYEMNKDGFMLVVMSYTGLKAMAIKVWYINAFNLMHEKLFPRTQNGLKELPEPPTITKAQQGILFNKVVDIAAGRGQIRSQIWSRFQNHFKLNSYKNLPAEQFDDATAYLKAKQYEYNNGAEMMYVSNFELAAMVDERVKAIEGELLPKQDRLYTPMPFTEQKDYNLAKKVLANISQQVSGDMKEDIRLLERCLVQAWTEMDEALFRLDAATGFLRRWRNRPAG